MMLNWKEDSFSNSERGNKWSVYIFAHHTTVQNMWDKEQTWIYKDYASQIRRYGKGFVCVENLKNKLIWHFGRIWFFVLDRSHSSHKTNNVNVDLKPSLKIEHSKQFDFKIQAGRRHIEMVLCMTKAKHSVKK